MELLTQQNSKIFPQTALKDTFCNRGEMFSVTYELHFKILFTWTARFKEMPERYVLWPSSALGAIRNYDYLTAASVLHQCVSFSELTKPQLDRRRGSIQLRALTRPDTAVRPHWPHDLTSKTAYHQRGLKLARIQLPYPPDRIVREVGAARHQSPRSTFEHNTALTAAVCVSECPHTAYRTTNG